MGGGKKKNEFLLPRRGRRRGMLNVFFFFFFLSRIHGTTRLLSCFSSVHVNSYFSRRRTISINIVSGALEPFWTSLQGGFEKIFKRYCASDRRRREQIGSRENQPPLVVKKKHEHASLPPSLPPPLREGKGNACWEYNTYRYISTFFFFFQFLFFFLFFLLFVFPFFSRYQNCPKTCCCCCCCVDRGVEASNTLEKRNDLILSSMETTSHESVLDFSYAEILHVNFILIVSSLIYIYI